MYSNNGVLTVRTSSWDCPMQE